MFHDEVKLFQTSGVWIIGSFITGAVVGLSDDSYRLCLLASKGDLTADEFKRIDPRLFECLQKGLFFRLDNKKRVAVAYLHITELCNLDCVGCYMGANNASSSFLPLEQAASIVKRFAEYGIKRVVVTGGEPTLHKDLINVLMYLKRGGIEQVELLTNGTLLNEEMIVNAAPFLDRVSISFDGVSADEIPYIRNEQDLGSLTSNARMVKRCGVDVGIVITIHKHNYRLIPKYEKFANDLGVGLNFSLFSSPLCSTKASSLVMDDDDLMNLSSIMLESLNGSHAESRKVVPLLARDKCGACNGVISIDSAARVYPCHMCHSREFELGSIIDTSIADLLETEVAKQFLMIDVDGFKECESCDVRYFCGGGCRSRSFSDSGNLRGRDPYCVLMKTFYHGVLDRLVDFKE